MFKFKFLPQGSSRAAHLVRHLPSKTATILSIVNAGNADAILENYTELNCTHEVLFDSITQLVYYTRLQTSIYEMGPLSVLELLGMGTVHHQCSHSGHINYCSWSTPSISAVQLRETVERMNHLHMFREVRDWHPTENSGFQLTERGWKP